MAGYEIYEPHLDYMKKIVKQAQRLYPKRTRIRTHADAMKFYMENPDNFEFMGGNDRGDILHVSTSEWEWLKNPLPPVLFPESADLLDRLYQATANVTDLSKLRFPHDAFVIATPKGYSISGFPVHSMLVHVVNAKDLSKKINRYWGECVELVEDSYDRAYFYWNDGDNRQVMNIPLKENLNDFGDGCDHAEELRLHGRLLLMMCLYMQSCPEKVVAGFPGDYRPPIGSKKRDYRIAPIQLGGMDSLNRSEVGMHYRSAHFRHYWDERYYQGEYAHLERGTRFSMIKDCMVKKEVEAKTILD